MTTLGSGFASKAYDAVSEHAAAFLERRRFGAWSEADQAEFDAWLDESLLHRAAYLRLEGAIVYAEELVALRPSEPRPLSNEVAPLVEPKPGYRRFVLPLLVAASTALFMMFGIPFVKSLMQSPERNFSTDVGGRTLVKFVDGTEIELNTDTAMRFRMTTVERKVWLEKGEAWFHVAHNAAHPFTVFVGAHRITDLGTEFLIRRGSENVEVALLNGRAMLNTEGTPTTMLVPGDEATATPTSVSVTRKSAQELADELAWRRGVLVFRNTKLADVVREFNRYNATKLVIADPSISNVEITAEIKTDHFDDLLALVHTVLNLRADREGNNILISREQPDETKRAARAKRSL